MREKQILLLPGPTPVPPRVLRAMAAPAINHRGPEFKELLFEVTEGVKKIYQTENDLFLLTASGTGAMEAAVANFVNEGDKVLVASIGAFGDRFAKICAQYGALVDKLDYQWGTAVNPEDIKAKLLDDTKKEIKAVFVQHNETSTGVLNDIKAISQARGDHPALLIVDAISGLAAAELLTDDWGLDVVISGSQKAFMMPPGLATISVSKRAWAAYSAESPKFYFDLKPYKEYFEKGQPPWTPAISLVQGLRESLQIMLEEGLENIIRRHYLHRDMVRAAIKAIGLELLAQDQVASPAVTAVKSPAGILPSTITGKMREKYNVVVAGGQAKLKDEIFRIGHLGYVQPADLLAALAALEMVLRDEGIDVKLGSAVAAAQQVLEEKGGK